MPTTTPNTAAFARDVLAFVYDWQDNPNPVDYNHPITRLGRAGFLQRAMVAVSIGTEQAMSQFATDYMHLGQS